jgi:hypothetical protein
MPYREGGQQFAVVIIEGHVARDSEPARGLLGFGAPPASKCAATFGLVTGIASGQSDKLNLVPQAGELDSRAAGAIVAIIRMRAERNNAKGAASGLRDGKGSYAEEEQREREHDV